MQPGYLIIVSKDPNESRPLSIWSLSINSILSRFLSDFEMVVIDCEKLDQNYVTEFIDEIRKLDCFFDEIKIEIDCSHDRVNKKMYMLSKKSHLEKFIGMDKTTESEKTALINNYSKLF